MNQDPRDGSCPPAATAQWELLAWVWRCPPSMSGPEVPRGLSLLAWCSPMHARPLWTVAHVQRGLPFQARWSSQMPCVLEAQAHEAVGNASQSLQGPASLNSDRSPEVAYTYAGDGGSGVGAWQRCVTMSTTWGFAPPTVWGFDALAFCTK